MIQVIDYGGGNIGSLLRSLERLEFTYQLIANGNDLSGNNAVILPGVGAFGATMHSLGERDFIQPLKSLVTDGLPYLGICVGLQVLLDASDESPGVLGLGLIPGQVQQFSAAKVPQIGWNRIESQNQDYPEGYAYFVNSYYAVPKDERTVSYKAQYEGPFCAGIASKNITAFQFHPEKSGVFGHQLIQDWVKQYAA